MMKLSRFVLFLVAFPTLATQASQTADQPNVIFIMADDLGINDLSCYGRKDQHTPNLDRMAAQGVRFTSSYCAQPICSPSRAAILSGHSPARLHLTTYLPGRGDSPAQKLLHPKIEMQLPTDEVTLAERFKAVGYATACIGKWHLGDGKKYAPNARGFDVVEAGKANTTPSESEGGKGEFHLTKAASDFIHKNKDRPFFLYLPHNNPHIPLDAQPRRIESNQGSFNPTYAAMIETLDESVGRILKDLDDLRLTDKTIVIFTSDNGGLHVPEGQLTPATHNSPFRAGKGFVYEGGLRVPLIVRWPAKSPAGQTVDAPVINTDWTATFAELCSFASVKASDGTSFAPLLKGGQIAERPLFWHFPHYTNQGSRPAGAVRFKKWKLVEHYEDGSHELYDIDRDLGESTNLAKENPEIVADLSRKLEAWRRSVGAQINQVNPNFDPSLHKRIYVDFDVSRLKPASNAREMRPPLELWRTLMAEAVRRK